MQIAVYGSSLLSSYWNGAATYYRGLFGAMARRGHQIVFLEPDAFGRQQNRDIAPPDWARVVVYQATPDGVRGALAEAGEAEVVIKCSGVGVFDDELLVGILNARVVDAVRAFLDVDAPATLAELRSSDGHPLRLVLPTLDLVLTYGGGDPVRDAYLGFGAHACVPIYNALDPDTHHPVPPDPAYASTLALLANRLPDREARIEEFFLRPAALLPDERFLLGGSGWHDKPLVNNVHAIGHVPPAEHNALNASARAVLNVARDSMAAVGFSPATRVFEAAGAGACLITDAWEGIELFLQPDQEILVARDGQDVAEHLRALTPERARAIGGRGRARILAQHTYDRRAALLEQVLGDAVAVRRARA